MKMRATGCPSPSDLWGQEGLAEFRCFLWVQVGAKSFPGPSILALTMTSIGRY